eukprot:4084913-Prymnesium_polylepis.1
MRRRILHISGSGPPPSHAMNAGDARQKLLEDALYSRLEMQSLDELVETLKLVFGGFSAVQHTFRVDGSKIVYQRGDASDELDCSAEPSTSCGTKMIEWWKDAFRAEKEKPYLEHNVQEELLKRVNNASPSTWNFE